jgi:hypothetical protein
MPAIQIRLVAGTADQFATVSYTALAESTLVLTLRPVSPDSVALVIASPDGSLSALSPVPTQPGIYRAHVTPVPGSTYRLTGVVAGLDVEASVTTPGPLVVQVPLSDTLYVSSRNGNPQVPYVWSASGAGSYEVVSSNGSQSVTYDRTDTAGTIILLPFRPGADTTEVVVRAIDSASSQSNTRGALGPRLGNIRGALGLFGAATPARPKTIIWQ